MTVEESEIIYVGREESFDNSHYTGLNKRFVDDHDRLTAVSVNDLGYGPDRLASYGFACCNAVALLDGNKKLGGLAHLSIGKDPFKLFGGYGSQRERVFGINEMYENPKDVSAIHIRHDQLAATNSDDIEDALRKQGIENIMHVHIKTEKRGPYWRRDVGIDVKKGECYIFLEQTSNPIVLKFFEERK